MTATEKRVIFRNVVQVWVSILWLTLVVCDLAIHYLRGSSAPNAVVVVWLVLGGLSLASASRYAVMLTPAGLIRRKLRSARIQWSEIRSIEVRDQMISRFVVVHTADGKRQQLPVPTDYFGAASNRFFGHLELIEQYWLTYRGPDWQPVASDG